MPIGQKAGSLRNLKKNLSKNSGGGKGFIKYIPKNSSINVRFITEPEGWVSYAEHFDPVARRSFPCTTESDCPGCKLGIDKKNKYLANVVNLDNNDRVTALQLPVSLANTLVTKYEKWGSIVSRDLELSRQGEQLDTTYDLDYSPEDTKRVDKYQPLDLEEVLQAALDDYLGGDEAEEAPPKRSGRKAASAPRKRAAAPAPVDEDEDEDEDEPEPPKAPRKRAAAPRKASEPEFVPDDEPDEDEAEDPEPDDDVDDDDGYTVEELESMTLGQLRKVAREEFGVNTRGLTQADVLDAILEEDDQT